MGIKSKEIKTNQIFPTKKRFTFLNVTILQFYSATLLQNQIGKQIHDCRMKQDKKGENIGVSLDTKSQGTAVSNTTRRLREAKPVFATGKNPPSGQTGFCARREPVAFINHIVYTVRTVNELFVSLSAIN